MDDDHTFIHMEEDTALAYEDEQDNIDDDYDYEDEDVEDYEDEEVEDMMILSGTTSGSTRVDGLVDGLKESEVKEMKRDEIDVCPICFEVWTSGGDHRMCCLPCGHIYGMSCIRKWLMWCQGDGKCPRCKRLCTLKDIRVLYATRLCVYDEKPHEAYATNFPCTKEEGFSGFQQYVSSSMDALKQRIDALERRTEEFDARLHFLEQSFNELRGQVPEYSR